MVPSCIRFAAPADAPCLAAIFAPYVLQTAITFALEPPSSESFAVRIQGEHYPVLVLESEEEVVAYAFAGAHRAAASFRWGAEVSLYVHADHHRRGYARRLYAALLAILREQGILRAYAVIALPNDPSVALHQGMGFRPFARFSAAGFKHGLWRDVGWWELPLVSPLPVPPPEVEPIAAVREKRSVALSRILSESPGDR